MSEDKSLRRQVAADFLAGLDNKSSPLIFPRAAGVSRPPLGFLSGQPYTGINRLILSLANENSDPRWLTKNQAEKLGYTPRDSARPVKLVFWRQDKTEPLLDEDGRPRLGQDGRPLTRTGGRERPLLSHYQVYHTRDLRTEDGEELPSYEVPLPERGPLERATDILAASEVAIKTIPSGEAGYNPRTEAIHLPPRELTPDEDYLALALQGLAEREIYRPARREGPLEEPEQLVVKSLQTAIAGLMVTQDLGLPSRPKVDSLTLMVWKNQLEKNPDLLFQAAAQAEKVRARIMGLEQGRAQAPGPEPFEVQLLRGRVESHDGPGEQPWVVIGPEAMEELTVCAVVRRDDRLIVSTHHEIGLAREEARQRNEDQKFTPQLCGEKIYLEVPWSQKDLVKALGATWDRQVQAWCARPGLDLRPLKTWIPAQELQRTREKMIALDRDYLVLDVPYKDRELAKEMGAFWHDQEKAWAVSSRHVRLADLTKLWRPVPDRALLLGDVIDPLAAVPELAQEAVVLEVPFGENFQAKAAGARFDPEAKRWLAPVGADLNRLARWIPEKELAPEQALPAAEELARLLAEKGFVLAEPPQIDGRIHRVPVASDRPPAKGGAYYAGVSGGRPNGWLKNHRTGEYQSWLYTGQVLSPEQKEGLKKEAAVRQKSRSPKKRSEKSPLKAASEKSANQTTGLSR